MVLIQICMWETHLTNHDPAIQVQAIQAIQDFFFRIRAIFWGKHWPVDIETGDGSKSMIIAVIASGK